MSTLVNIVLGVVLSFLGYDAAEDQNHLSTDSVKTENIDTIAKTSSINQNELFKCNTEG